MSKYIGEETKKALRNFPQIFDQVDIEFIKSLAVVKVASANTNLKLKIIDKKIHSAILRSLQEIIKGSLDTEFALSGIQGGAGTSINMNMNEVVANRASEISGINIEPIAHANLSQSTNDTVPTALKLYCLRKIDDYLVVLEKLQHSFVVKSKEFSRIKKVGRTHIQDAVPITLGQEFGAYGHVVKNDIARLFYLKKQLTITNLGGTAIGTMENSSREYVNLVNKELSRLTRYDFKPAKNLIEATSNIDPFMMVSDYIKWSALGYAKISNDIKFLSSGPRAGINEINLPEMQKGSSIMPGKTNPVIPEMINQVYNHVFGNSVAVTMAVFEGQLELNTMLPTVIRSITESFNLLTTSIETFGKTVSKITANKEVCERLYKNSLILTTKLSKYIGYENAEKMAKIAYDNGTNVIDEALKSNLINKSTYNNLLKV
jgi:aspartate ammonia-lyase